MNETRADTRRGVGISFTIALLGRRDQPTDAVEDYCRLLGGAFKERGVDFALQRVAWNEIGWLGALRTLWQRSADWKGDWVLVQYTALMWLRHGFPLLFALVLCVLKIRGVRTSVVFHDSKPHGGARDVDRLRFVCQRAVMRWAYKLSDRSVFTTPVERVCWLPRSGTRSSYIPIGANVPAIAKPRARRNGHNVKTIAVFSVTDGGDISREVADITLAAKRAAERLPCEVRLVTLGRGSKESKSKFRVALAGSTVKFSAMGILPADKVSQVLADSDVALYVRSPITTQRGSAIAALCNTVPLVAYAKPTLPPPLAEAGVIPISYLDGEKLAEATVRVLADPQLWLDLHERSRRAYEKYFSWEAVASRFLEVLYRP
jgi:glycosyltransferase involved in cell wall biosynthesis